MHLAVVSLVVISLDTTYIVVKVKLISATYFISEKRRSLCKLLYGSLIDVCLKTKAKKQGKRQCLNISLLFANECDCAMNYQMKM